MNKHNSTRIIIKIDFIIQINDAGAWIFPKSGLNDPGCVDHILHIAFFILIDNKIIVCLFQISFKDFKVNFSLDELLDAIMQGEAGHTAIHELTTLHNNLSFNILWCLNLPGIIN